MHGVVAVQHDEVALQHAQPVVGAHGSRLAVGEVDAYGLGLAGPRSVGSEPQMPRVAPQRRQQRLRHRGVIEGDGHGAVGVHDAPDFGSHQVQRLVPADALPFVPAAHFAVAGLAAAGLPALALHGVLDAVGTESVHALGAPARAGAVLEIVEAVFFDVVGFDAHGHAVYHIGFQQAAPSAAGPAAHGHPFAALRRVELGIHSPSCPVCGRRTFSRGVQGAFRRASGHHGRCGQGACPHERTS